MDSDLGSSLRALTRLIGYMAVTVPAIAIQVLALALRLKFARRFPRYYHRACLRILGIQVSTSGAISDVSPTLFIANHSSYLDIPVLGAVIDGSFIAKAEVASWPLFGLLAKLQRTVFIDRQRQHAASHSHDIKGRLGKGDRLILFPEGTSSDGNRTLPFKTSLFSVTSLRICDADGERPLVVQPISITCVALDGMPTGRFLRPVYAWYGDLPLVPHLWRLLSLGRITVSVNFHDPVDVETLGSRKAVAEHCWQVVSDGVSDAVSGHSVRQRRRITRRARGARPATEVKRASA